MHHRRILKITNFKEIYIYLKNLIKILVQLRDNYEDYNYFLYET